MAHVPVRGKNGRHAPSLEGQAGVADGVDTTVDDEEPPGLDASMDRARGQARGDALRPRHDAVLL